MKNNMFNLCGNSVAQIGFYLMQIDETQFTNTETHRDIINFMSQMALYLNDIVNKKHTITAEATVGATADDGTYLTRKEVIEKYHPVITAYGISQAINKHELVFTKIGNKYFFKTEDLDKWINNQKVKNKPTYIAAKLV